MKIKIFILLIPLFSACCFSQFKKLNQFEIKMAKKIEVGMSTDEVKKVLGRPKSIEGGFPDSKDRILFEIPAQVGQMNNSTWFYFYDQISISYIDSGGLIFYINGQKVTEELYRQYEDKTEVYLYKDEVIDKYMARSYETLQDPKLKKVTKDYRTEIKKEKPEEVTKHFIPIFCVIFDRGTQVVASTKTYFLIII